MDGQDRLREKAGPWPDHIFLILGESGDFPTIHAQKGSLEVKGKREAKGCSTHRPLQ